LKPEPHNAESQICMNESVVPGPEPAILS
jgi:hypothetical protein